MLLTHHHEDHIGGAAALRGELGLPVLAPAPALPLLAQGLRMPLYRKIVWRVPRTFAAEPLGEVVEGDGYRLRVIPTPGHAFSHVCLFDEERRWLFAGDLYVHERVRFLRRVENVWEHIASLRRVLALGPELLICDHAGIFENACERLERKIRWWGEPGRPGARATRPRPVRGSHRPASPRPRGPPHLAQPRRFLPPQSDPFAFIISLAWRMIMTSSNEPSLGALQRAVICLVTVVAAIELHELIHLGVGRLAGLPARFLHLTAVGVTPEEAARADPAALAWMNGVAPVATMVLGVLAFAATSAPRPSMGPRVRNALIWVAIFGVPYIGLQLMLAAAPIDVRGAGADSAAVIGGYFQAPSTIRSILTVVGLAAYMASGFWLGRLLGDFAERPDRSESLGARLAAVSVWRRILAAVIGLLWIGTVALGIDQLFQGYRMGQGLLLLGGTVEWAAFLALLVPWRRPGPTAVWRGLAPPRAAGRGLSFWPWASLRATSRSSDSCCSLRW